MAFNRNEYQRKLRQEKKASGTCRDCKEKIFNGQLFCEKHIHANRKAQREHVLNNIVNRKCIRCQDIAVKGLILCEKHREENRKRVYKRYYDCKEKKVCPRCAGPILDEFGHCPRSMCVPSRKRKR
jgi:hypothetical protein